jgi:hypothetical protein
MIADDGQYMLKSDGLHNGGKYGYLHTMMYNGYMYVIILRQKEAIEMKRCKRLGFAFQGYLHVNRHLNKKLSIY